MTDAPNRQVRATSARQPVLRPQSGKYRRTHQKTQFLDNVIGNHDYNYHSFHKNKVFSMRANMPQLDQEDVSRIVAKPQQNYKDKEQLIEQNLLLKKEINKMTDELLKKRTKIETLNSQNSKYTKQLNREFEKKIYWNGNNDYLISGIKAQYEKLKEQFHQKQVQCKALKKEVVESRATEFKIYAETLQEENKKLNQRVGKMAELSEQVLFNDKSRSVPEHIYQELEEKKDRLKHKLQESKTQLTAEKAHNKQLNKKIEFLEKLLIEKDNAQYHAVRKAKKLERERAEIDARVKELEESQAMISKSHEQKLEKFKKMEEKRFKAEKDIFDRALQQKDARIQKLQKEVAYLSTLLTYWKPLDELNKDYNDKFSEQDEPLAFHSKKQADQSRKAQQINLQNSHMNQSKRIRRPSQFSSKNGEFVLKNSMELNNELRESVRLEAPKGARVQQTADHRHSDTAEKKRKVEYKQVEHLGEHLRYRFLGLRLGIEEVKKYFDHRKQERNFILSQEQQDSWNQQYISMRQTKQILMAHPFELSEQEAHLLARYMIEDSNNEYVYVDENNEHKRSIVKSILKALVGNYEILEGDKAAQVEAQCQAMLQKYQANLISALTTMASSGFISRKKFLEFINSLGIELSEEGRDYLVCKMLLKSDSLDRLSYMLIFE